MYSRVHISLRMHHCIIILSHIFRFGAHLTPMPKTKSQYLSEQRHDHYTLFLILQHGNQPLILKVFQLLKSFTHRRLINLGHFQLHRPWSKRHLLLQLLSVLHRPWHVLHRPWRCRNGALLCFSFCFSSCSHHTIILEVANDET